MNNIKVIRQQTCLTQRAFAEKFGIPLRTLQSWEAGERTPAEYIVNMIVSILKMERRKEMNEFYAVDLDNEGRVEFCMSFTATAAFQANVGDPGVVVLDRGHCMGRVEFLPGSVLCSRMYGYLERFDGPLPKPYGE